MYTKIYTAISQMYWNWLAQPVFLNNVPLLFVVAVEIHGLQKREREDAVVP